MYHEKQHPIVRDPLSRKPLVRLGDGCTPRREHGSPASEETAGEKVPHLGRIVYDTVPGRHVADPYAQRHHGCGCLFAVFSETTRIPRFALGIDDTPE